MMFVTGDANAREIVRPQRSIAPSAEPTAVTMSHQWSNAHVSTDHVLRFLCVIADPDQTKTDGSVRTDRNAAASTLTAREAVIFGY
jgi:hypothetical protein